MVGLGYVALAPAGVVLATGHAPLGSLASLGALLAAGVAGGVAVAATVVAQAAGCPPETKRLALSLHVVTLAAALGGMEWLYQEADLDLLLGCSMVVTKLRLSNASRLLAGLVAAAGWFGGLALLGRPGRRAPALVAMGLGVWLASGNYRVYAHSLCGAWIVQDLPRALLFLGPVRTLDPPPDGGPVDPTDPAHLPVDAPAASIACTRSAGGTLWFYRIGAEPLRVDAPLGRRWAPHATAVANVFHRGEGTRVVWVCGQDAPVEVFEAVAAAEAREEGLSVEHLTALPTEAGTTRYEAILVP